MTARPVDPESRRIPVYAAVALVLVMVAVLLAAGCMSESSTGIRTDNVSTTNISTGNLTSGNVTSGIVAEGIEEKSRFTVVTTTYPESQTEVPAGNYIFLEHQVRTQGKTLNGDCTPELNFDGPTYYLDEKKGTLSASRNSINESLLMFYATGNSEDTSVRAGAYAYASPVYALPETFRDNVTIISSTAEGIVTLNYNNTSIVLKSKDRWAVNTTPVIRKRQRYDTICTEEIVITDSIYNAGFFDKQKIRTH